VQKFKYLGQVNSGATLQLEGGESLEVLFFKGKEVALVAQGLLEAIEVKTASKAVRKAQQEND
jgi:hypothetical protein